MSAIQVLYHKAGFFGISKGHIVNQELTDDRGNAKIALPVIFR